MPIWITTHSVDAQRELKMHDGLFIITLKCVFILNPESMCLSSLPVSILSIYLADGDRLWFQSEFPQVDSNAAGVQQQHVRQLNSAGTTYCAVPFCLV